MDRHNVSILSVEGIGFKPYVAICDALNIPWVLRTDNDIFLKPNNAPTQKYYAGISRIMGIIKGIGDNGTGLLDHWEKHSLENEWPKEKEIPDDAKKLNKHIRDIAEQLGIFLSDIDLENDLAKSALTDILMTHYGKKSHETLISAMQKKKAENMMSFLATNHDQLSMLNDSKILVPLKMLIKMATKRTRPGNDDGTN